MAATSSKAPRSIVQLLGKRLSTATVFFHAAVADRMGVTVSDAKCRSLLLQHGPLSAGDLAQRLGLTTGAVTGVIDRLTRARWVMRVPDPVDRRRVTVHLARHPKRDRDLERLFEPMSKRIHALVAGYDRREQECILEFVTKASEILEEETTRLRAKP